jgi:hypothetical protein
MIQRFVFIQVYRYFIGFLVHFSRQLIIVTDYSHLVVMRLCKFEILLGLLNIFNFFFIFLIIIRPHKFLSLSTPQTSLLNNNTIFITSSIKPLCILLKEDYILYEKNILHGVIDVSIE